MTVKYADAIPFYRMEGVLDWYGLSLSRAGLYKLAVSVRKSIADLTDFMKRDIVRSPVMLMDEPTIKVFGSGPPGKESYMWVVVGYCDGKLIK